MDNKHLIVLEKIAEAYYTQMDESGISAGSDVALTYCHILRTIIKIKERTPTVINE